MNYSRIRYKCPKLHGTLYSVKNVYYVTIEELLEEDDRVPLLLYNYQIYPDCLKTLQEFRGREVALLKKHYLSGRETRIWHILVDDEFDEHFIRGR